MAMSSLLILSNFFPGIQDEFSDPDLAVMGEESKSENGENAPVYCICRKPDINCFMMWVLLEGIKELGNGGSFTRYEVVLRMAASAKLFWQYDMCWFISARSSGTCSLKLNIFNFKFLKLCSFWWILFNIKILMADEKGKRRGSVKDTVKRNNKDNILLNKVFTRANYPIFPKYCKN